MIVLVEFFALLLLFPLGLIFCTIVARDMDRRGLDGRVYGLITFLVLPVGIALWLWKRSTTDVVEATDT